MFPGDPSRPAAEVCNCRCALLQRARSALKTPFSKWDSQNRELIDFSGIEEYNTFKEKYFNWQSKNKSGAFNSFGTGKNIPFNSRASFKVEIPVYSESLNEAISKSCKEVAKKGSSTGKEYLELINIKTGKVVYSEEGSENNVGFENFTKFITEQKNEKFVFVHNHPNGEMLSIGDMNTFFSSPIYDSMVASGHDGSLYVVYEKNKPLTSRSAISEAMKKDNELLADIRLLLKQGKIDIPDFSREAEKRRVNYLISNYCEYIEVKT